MLFIFLRVLRFIFYLLVVPLQHFSASTSREWRDEGGGRGISEGLNETNGNVYRRRNVHPMMFTCNFFFFAREQKCKNREECTIPRSDCQSDSGGGKAVDI
ncbi:hypothetical protein F5H01DRAFT_335684, partial [Linnemannia elongata]